MRKIESKKNHTAAACFRTVISLLGASALVGCATVDQEYTDERDPFEGFNRAMYTFNENLDQYVAKPLAKGYQYITPGPVDRGITRFFSNIDDVRNALNNGLQLKFQPAASDIGRFAINSTIGVLGFTDPASEMGMEKHDEDFGQTLGFWGMGPGPYLVLPVIGPSSGRDLVGFGVDWVSDPIYWEVDDLGVSWGLYIVRYVDRRADLLTVTRVMEDAALDPYAFMRESYLQRRQHLVYDGNPPEQDDFFP